MASRRTGSAIGVITTPIALHCCICWLAGGFHHGIRLTAGMSKTSFNCHAHRGAFLQLMNVMLLHTKFPSKTLEVECEAQEIKSICSNGVMEGHVAAMGELIVKTIVPGKSEVGNMRAFFSGHHHHYGFSAQVNIFLLYCFLFYPNNF